MLLLHYYPFDVSWNLHEKNIDVLEMELNSIDDTSLRVCEGRNVFVARKRGTFFHKLRVSYKDERKTQLKCFFLK